MVKTRLQQRPSIHGLWAHVHTGVASSQVKLSSHIHSLNMAIYEMVFESLVFQVPVSNKNPGAQGTYQEPI